jgi:hypothetical protein
LHALLDWIFWSKNKNKIEAGERERRERDREKRRTLSQSQKLVAQSTFAAKQYSFKMTFNIALIFQL